MKSEEEERRPKIEEKINLGRRVRKWQSMAKAGEIKRSENEENINIRAASWRKKSQRIKPGYRKRGENLKISKKKNIANSNESEKRGRENNGMAAISTTSNETKRGGNSK